MKKLVEIKPELQSEYHVDKNSISFEQLNAYGKTKVWWTCPACHEDYPMSPKSRVHQGSGCLYCAGKKVRPGESLFELHPHLGTQWHSEKNKGIDPVQISPFSSRKYWWICEKEHEWEARVKSRTQGRGCPYCAGTYVAPENLLSVTHPHVIAALHPEKNKNIDKNKISAKSRIRAVFICSKGHEFRQSITSYAKYGEKCDTCKAVLEESIRLEKENRTTISVYEAWVQGKRVPSGFWKEDKEAKIIEIIRYVILEKDGYASKKAFLSHITDVSQYISDMQISSVVRKTFGSEGQALIEAMPEWDIQKEEIRKRKGNSIRN